MRDPTEITAPGHFRRDEEEELINREEEEEEEEEAESMEGNSRESRRKKIREGQQDRMALITGRLQSLPSSPLTSAQQPRHSHTASSPLLPFINGNIFFEFPRH